MKLKPLLLTISQFLINMSPLLAGFLIHDSKPLISSFGYLLAGIWLTLITIQIKGEKNE